MSVARLDPHAHLYDCYAVRDWVEAALANLRPDADSYAGVVVVDREGQDSFSRLRQEVPEFAQWRESELRCEGTNLPVVAYVQHLNCELTVIRGVQYVTAERLEVLSFGAPRVLEDGAPCDQVIDQIRGMGGLVCIPWSPGKWLGKRGKVIQGLLKKYRAGELLFGDISMRSRSGPPSLLLRKARQHGFSVLPGTDPLPRQEDVGLVGSYGIEITVKNESRGDACFNALMEYSRYSAAEQRIWGKANSSIQALLRFIATL